MCRCGTLADMGEKRATGVHCVLKLISLAAADLVTATGTFCDAQGSVRELSLVQHKLQEIWLASATASVVTRGRANTCRSQICVDDKRVHRLPLLAWRLCIVGAPTFVSRSWRGCCLLVVAVDSMACRDWYKAGAKINGCQPLVGLNVLQIR